VSMFIGAATGATVSIDIVPAIIMLAVLFAISAATSLWVFGVVRRAPVTQRLRLE